MDIAVARLIAEKRSERWIGQEYSWLMIREVNCGTSEWHVNQDSWRPQYSFPGGDISSTEGNRAPGNPRSQSGYESSVVACSAAVLVSLPGPELVHRDTRCHSDVDRVNLTVDGDLDLEGGGIHEAGW